VQGKEELLLSDNIIYNMHPADYNIIITFPIKLKLLHKQRLDLLVRVVHY